MAKRMGAKTIEVKASHVSLNIAAGHNDEPHSSGGRNNVESRFLMLEEIMPAMEYRRQFDLVQATRGRQLVRKTSQNAIPVWHSRPTVFLYDRGLDDFS
jgi:hypothetical protein